MNSVLNIKYEHKLKDHTLKSVIILAAGSGTRMQTKLPKVLHNICGISIIHRILRTVSDLDPAQLIVTVKHQRDLIKNHILSSFKNNLTFVKQDDVYGTGRSVELALRHIRNLNLNCGKTILVVYGDVPLLKKEILINMLNYHYEKKNIATVMSTFLDNASGYGRIIKDNQGNIIKIVEDKYTSFNESNIKEINSGIYLFDENILYDSLSKISTNLKSNEKYLTDALSYMYENYQKKTSTFLCKDTWQVRGVNSLKELTEISIECNRRILEKWMNCGVCIIDPRNTWIDSTVKLNKNITILPNTQLYGLTNLSSGTIIGPNTTLSNTFVERNVRITCSYMHDCIIKNNARIGPFAYIRPNSIIKSNGKIGAFVEVKDATIGKNSKISHLSYVGNAIIGKNSNIGAGSVFANYDGIDKHYTIIGDNTHMGSNNVYVAPVIVGDNVYSGAGAIIRKNVPSGSLALNNNAQKNLHNWVKKNRPNHKSLKNKNKVLGK